MRIAFVLGLAAALALGTGCSISNSSESISDSISSPSESISHSSKSSSDSSGGGDDDAPAPESSEETASYERDVSELTQAYLSSGGDLDAFRSAVADLATNRGITDWEADPATTRAIGRGAGEAGLDEHAFTAFGSELVGEAPTVRAALRRGYEQARSSAASAAPEAASDRNAAESTGGDRS
jgi:hypothetical protein